LWEEEKEEAPGAADVVGEGPAAEGPLGGLEVPSGVPELGDEGGTGGLQVGEQQLAGAWTGGAAAGGGDLGVSDRR